MYNDNEMKSVERYSSAITLSDMEIFIFPELLFSLVLANIISPRIWQWREDPWFKAIPSMSPARRVHRLKQYIMDHFSFNLDLDTWGLTTKERELARFSGFISPEVISRSNALFGYEGDKYYFKSDIRKHFGLDKYTDDTIPYWKTETLEAMEAFSFKPGYSMGAGECVSLSTLYAAAAFVVIGVPLDDIFVMTTPLHSQCFFNVGEGILSNNRRIVTKTMWFNGSELSAKARRALENEHVTIVANKSGYIHSIYPESTISDERYRQMSRKLRAFLSTDRIDFEILANFLRHNSKLQRCFQICHPCHGKARYIEAEKVFSYEHSSKARVSDSTRDTLLREIEEDEFYPEPMAGRLLLNELEEFFKTTHVSLDDPATIEKLKAQLHHACYNVDQVIPDLNSFCRTVPRLPDRESKRFFETPSIDLENAASAEEVQERIGALRSKNISCDLAFAAFRDQKRSPWRPFIKAAIERNPVSRTGMKDMTIEQAYEKLKSLPDASIYAEPFRIAQPDEVWNFGRGDGLEKAITLANIIRDRDPQARLGMEKRGNKIALVNNNANAYEFTTVKSVEMPREKDF